MEIVTVSDRDADFRDKITDRVSYLKEGWGNHEQKFIATAIPNIRLRVLQVGNWKPDYYVSIEFTDKGELTNRNRKEVILGCVELLNNNSLHIGPCFEPHSFIDKNHRGKGYIESIYRWVLDNGFTLVSGPRQTIYSEGLWNKLSKDYKFDYVNIYDDVKTVDCLEENNYYSRKRLKLL